MLKLLYLDLNRRAASNSTYTSQRSNASACCASKLRRECALLLGGADTLRERPRVRVHAAAGLMALLAV